MSQLLRLTTLWLFSGTLFSSVALANQTVEQKSKPAPLQDQESGYLKAGSFIAQHSYLLTGEGGFSLFNPVIELRISGQFQANQPPSTLIITKPTEPPYNLEKPLSMQISMNGWNQSLQYDHQVELRELCFSPKKQTLLVLFHQWNGGASDPGDYFALRYDEASHKFIKQDIEDSRRDLSLEEMNLIDCRAEQTTSLGLAEGYQPNLQSHEENHRNNQQQTMTTQGQACTCLFNER